MLENLNLGLHHEFILLILWWCKTFKKNLTVYAGKIHSLTSEMQLLLKLLLKQINMEFKSKKCIIYSEKNIELPYEHCTWKFK
jgi:hypothetical protein